jgi:hypothetical protein
VDAAKVIRKAMMTAKSVAGAVGVRPQFADGGAADMMPAEPVAPRALNNLGLYSAAAEAARALPQKSGTAQQMIASLKGVKPDELKWSGVAQRWAPTDKITKEDLAQHFEQNAPNMQESLLDDDAQSTRFKDYSTPGGTNYRESLLQYEPPKPQPSADQLKRSALLARLQNLRDRVAERTGVNRDNGYLLQRHMNDEEDTEHRAIQAQLRGVHEAGMPTTNLYQSSHWPGHPNVVAHLRLSDRYEPVRAKPRAKFNTEFQYAHRSGEMRTGKAWKTSVPGLVAHPSFEKGKRDIVVSHAPSGRAVQRGLDYQGAQDFAAHMGKIVPDWTQDEKTVTAPFDIKPGETPETSNTPNLRRIKARNAVMEEVEARRKAPPSGPAAKKALLLDELQSDWGQQKRDEGPQEGALGADERETLTAQAREFRRLANQMRGAATDMAGIGEAQGMLDRARDIETRLRETPVKSNIAEGPYIDNTQKWTDLGLKRALREAAEGGHTHLAWTPGENHAERYKLSKRLSELRLHSYGEHNPNVYLEAYAKGSGHRVFGSTIGKEQLASHVGKEVADRLLQQEEHGPIIGNTTGFRSLRGDDLSIGGRGMIGYYNNILPKRLLALAQEHDPGAKLTTLKSKDKHVNGFPALEITPRMRESIVKRGFKAFRDGGAVERGLSICRALGGAVNHNPTEAQKAAGNYRKAHVNFHGLDVSIENRKGSVRAGRDAGGKRWRCTLPADYGYIRRTEGADGDHVDCYIGPHPESTHVFVVNQRDAKTKAFDEHKIFLGFKSEAEAVSTYVKAFSDGKGSARMGGMQSMSMEAFKNWLQRGDTKAPAKHDDIVKHALSVA